MRESEILYPSLSLSQYIKYYWVLKTDEVEPVMIQTIPSGCMHLVFHRGDNLNIHERFTTEELYSGTIFHLWEFNFKG